MEKKNILIVEDHALTRFALSASLRDEDFIDRIYEAKDAYEGYEILSKEKIDVIIYGKSATHYYNGKEHERLLHG